MAGSSSSVTALNNDVIDSNAIHNARVQWERMTADYLDVVYTRRPAGSIVKKVSHPNSRAGFTDPARGGARPVVRQRGLGVQLAVEFFRAAQVRVARNPT